MEAPGNGLLIKSRGFDGRGKQEFPQEKNRDLSEKIRESTNSGKHGRNVVESPALFPGFLKDAIICILLPIADCTK